MLGTSRSVVVPARHGSCRRLGHVHAALAPSSVGQHAPVTHHTAPESLTESALQDLREQKAAAIEREDYAAVAQLHETLRCLTRRPSPHPPPRDAPTEEHTAFLHEHGFTTIQLFEAGEDVARLQAAWKRVQEPAVREWEEAKLDGVGIRGHGFANSPLPNNLCFAQRGTPVTFRGRFLARRWMDIPAEDFFAEAAEPAGDGILLDLIDHPLLVPLLHAYLGEAVQLAGVSPRTYPPNDTVASCDSDASTTEGSYTFWHRDGSKPDGFTQPTDAHDIKVFIHFEDIALDGGCTAVVPGSHKLLALPEDVFGADAFRKQNGTGVHLDSMPNSVPFAVPAGTGAHTFHPSSVILGYNTVVPRRCTGELIPPRMLEALESAGRLQSPTRRRLLAWRDGALLGQRGDWRGLYDEGERDSSYALDHVRESYFTRDS